MSPPLRAALDAQQSCGFLDSHTCQQQQQQQLGQDVLLVDGSAVGAAAGQQQAAAPHDFLTDDELQFGEIADAAAALSQQLQHAQQGGYGSSSRLSTVQHVHAQAAHHSASVALSALGASLLAANASSTAGSDFLPTNETDDLSSRIVASQSLLQSFYESQDVTVQHRQHNRVHARSVLLGNAGSAAAAAAAVAAMAAGSASHHAVLPGGW
eukprot:gene4155-4403_t